jgi:glucokinase
MARYAGIDLGGTKIQVAIVDEDHKLLGQARGQTPMDGGPEDVITAIEAEVRVAAQDAGIETSELDGIGVGSPGNVDDDAGTVASARNLPGWEGSYQVRDALEEALGAPVRLGNDVQVATDAEFELGAAKPYSSLLGVFWGTGVGGGIILDGKPWIGRSAAGEIGHVVVRIGGRRCPCGRRGCMEAYAGRGAMEARARKLVDGGRKTILFDIMRERGRTRLASGIFQRALHKGDKMAHDLIDEAVEALGAGVASAVNVLDVEAVVIGGGLGLRLGEPYLERIRAAMLPHLFVNEDPPAILLAELGDLGGAQGAALLAAKPRATAGAHS